MRGKGRVQVESQTARRTTARSLRAAPVPTFTSSPARFDNAIFPNIELVRSTVGAFRACHQRLLHVAAPHTSALAFIETFPRRLPNISSISSGVGSIARKGLGFRRKTYATFSPDVSHGAAW